MMSKDYRFVQSNRLILFMRVPVLALIVLFPLLAAIPANSQEDFVRTQGISSPVHQAQIGKIIFTAVSISPLTIRETDFLDKYVLTNKSNLFITVFLANSITNYLHQLAPELSADSLNKIGNYQFGLYIDDRLIYESNLYPGAPRARTQDTATIISKPLIDNQNEGAWWSQSFWNRFMRNGGDSVLTDGKHALKMLIRPYLQLGAETKVGAAIAEGKLELQVHRNPILDIPAIRLNKPKPYPGFEISTKHFDTTRIKTLIGNINEGVFKRINGVVVINNGKIQIEEYFNDDTRSTLHDPRSVGKTFASTITGIAIKEGYLQNEEQTLKDFYDLHDFGQYSPEKEKVSIKDLLTMSAVFDGDDNTNSPGNEENMYPTDNWVKFALDLPVDRVRPKGQWHYFTAGVVVLGDILHQKVPGGLEKYADQKLFRPLGITHYQWQYTPQKVANTAGGIRLCALDFAKYGQLYKNNGKWNGKQIIPVGWIAKSFSRQKSIPDRNAEYYGYLFWNKTYRVAGKVYETYYCSGNGGNKIFIFKDQPWVIVITASAYGSGMAHTQVDKMMSDYILPALVNQ